MEQDNRNQHLMEIEEAVLSGKVNELQNQDISLFLQEDKQDLWGAKVYADMSDETFLRFVNPHGKDFRYTRVYAKHLPCHELDCAARALKVKGQNHYFYEQFIEHGLNALKQDHSEKNFSLSAAQTFRKELAAYEQKFMQSGNYKNLLPDYEKYAQEAEKEFEQISHTDFLKTRTANNIKSIQEIFKFNHEPELIPQLEKYLVKFTSSDEKIAPFEAPHKKLPWLFGRKQAKLEQQITQGRVDKFNSVLGALSKEEKESLREYAHNAFDPKLPNQIWNTRPGYYKIKDAQKAKEQAEKDLKEATARYVGHENYLAAAHQSADERIHAAQQALRQKAENRVSDLTGIAPGAKSETTKIAPQKVHSPAKEISR